MGSVIMSMVGKVYLLLWVVVLTTITTKAKFSVSPEKNRIVDSHGRERFFHGTNVVFKTDPFIPITTHFDARYSFSVEDAQLLASMGYNTIRLGVLWAGLEPVEGEYNMTYLDMVEEIVVMAGERGIYSLLDMHQDAFNAKFCGNGVPDWAAKPKKENFPYPLEVQYDVDENGHPSREDCEKISWPNYHFSHSLSEATGRLYDNYEGLLDQFALFWGKVAEIFGENDYILGYEIVNEPWCGDVYEDPTLLIPGIADTRYLQPMYDLVNSEIRKHDSEHLIFFESVTWEIVGLGETIGFTHPPGGDDFKNRSVLSFHNCVKTDVTSDEDYYNFRLNEIKRLGIAGFVTETNNNGHDVFPLLDRIAEFGYSWHHWAYKRYGCITGDNAGFFHIDGCTKCEGGMDECLNTEAVLEYSRTFPAAIAGRGDYFHYDIDTKEAVLVFTPDPTVELPTVLKVPVAWHYKDGFTVQVAPEGVAGWSQGCCDLAANSTVEIFLTDSWSGEQITATLSALTV